MRLCLSFGQGNRLPRKRKRRGVKKLPHLCQWRAVLLLRSGRRHPLVSAPGPSATPAKTTTSKGHETADGVSHADQKEQTENRHRCLVVMASIFILHQPFPQRREKLPVKELTEELQTFSAQAVSLGSIPDASAITEVCFHRASLVFCRSIFHVIMVVRLGKR